MSVLGLAIGDALGMPFEMMHFTSAELAKWDGKFRSSLSTITRGLRPGQWTDDTKMARALATSLLKEGSYDQDDAARHYLEWYRSKDLRGIGNTTDQAMRNIAKGKMETGVAGSEGNGTAMRVAPIGLVFEDPQDVIAMAARDAALTHDSMEAKVGSALVALGVYYALHKRPKIDISTYAIEALNEKLLGDPKENYQVVKKVMEATEKAQTNPSLATLIDIGTGAWVVESVAAAYFCFMATDNFKDAVQLAVHGGGDTDTNAAITGALAGAYYGLDQMQEFSSVEDYERLVELDEKLYGLRRHRPPDGSTL